VTSYDIFFITLRILISHVFCCFAGMFIFGSLTACCWCRFGRVATETTTLLRQTNNIGDVLAFLYYSNTTIITMLYLSSYM